ncbi:PilN domain-containing protein [Patescibacteria group bacterium]
MQKKSINLLQERGAPPTFWEKLYEWVTNTCRIIVIITELLVLGAFGWRFWLDRTLNDLKEDIEVKGEVLKSLSEEEDGIRILQSKMETFSSLWDQSSNLTPIVKEINDYITTDIEDLSVSISSSEGGKTFTISGEMERDEISQIENDLKDSSSFSDVALSNIERSDEGSDIYSFSMTAKIIFDEVREPLEQNEGSESET